MMPTKPSKNPKATGLKTPILFITFKRPETTQRVFEKIKQVQPKTLYVAQNIPKDKNKEEIKKWNAVRTIIENIDWDCKVHKLYRKKYLNAKTSISTAIDWFFENEEEGIILEDDCLPDHTFFRFCEELLEKYRYDDRIAMISGNNFQFGKKRTEYSYYFSQYNHIWGWASWRRAWKNFDVEMKLWPEIRDDDGLKDILNNNKSIKYWKNIFEKTYNGEIDTWDYQWTFACWIQNQLTILPNVNLVANIGFGKDAVNTKNISDNRANRDIQKKEFPLNHPPHIIKNIRADEFTNKNFIIIPILKRLKLK